MKALYTLLIFLIPFVGFGQGWEQTYIYQNSNDNWGVSVTNNSESGYVFISGVEGVAGGGGDDISLFKTDENGNEQWSQLFGNSEGILSTYFPQYPNLVVKTTGYSGEQTNDGGYIIAGSTWDTIYGKFDGNNLLVVNYAYLIKTDENGDEQWNKTFGGTTNLNRAHSVKQTNDGGYIITGYTLENDDYDVLLIKTDENGNEQWSKTFGGATSRDYGYSVKQTNDGGYIITGYTRENNDYDVLLIKTDENGNEQWSKTFGETMFDIGYSAQQTTDGGYILIGCKTPNAKTLSFEIGGNDIFLIKTDEGGNLQWSKTFEGSISISFLPVHYNTNSLQTTDGGYIITGYTLENDDYDVLLIKTDENGNEQWSKTFGETMFDVGYSIQQTNDGGYIILGSCSPGVSYLIKTDGNGNITSTFEVPLPNPNRKLEKTINLKGQEVKPQTNQPIIEIYDDGTVEKKVIIE